MLNIGLHCVISALMVDVFTILIAGFACDGKAKRLAHFPKASVLAALLFAAHPVHTESVSRKEKKKRTWLSMPACSVNNHTTIALLPGHHIKRTLKRQAQLVCISKVCCGADQLC